MKFEIVENTGFYLRMGITGPAGSGKTYTALKVATEFGVDKVGIIDTEAKSARRYAKAFSRRFSALELDHFSPQEYIEAIQAAEQAGIEFLVIDSLSHAWVGKGGVLEMADQAAKRNKTGNSFAAWRDVTPEHNRLVDTILRASMHIIATFRSKTEYVIDQGPQGKSVPRKVGLAPIQREGFEYEFDVFGDLDTDNNLVISKSRCPALSGAVINKPGIELATTLSNWVHPPENPAEPWIKRIEDVNHAEQLDLIREDLNRSRAQGLRFNDEQNKMIRNALESAKTRVSSAEQAS